jgi:hypothetical protein
MRLIFAKGLWVRLSASLKTLDNFGGGAPS